jgi:hypothetical protein
MRTIFGTVFAAASVGCLLVGTACAGVWHKYEGNPVLGGESLGTCFDVNVVTNGPAPYTMYFSWRPKKAIALVRRDPVLVPEKGYEKLSTMNPYVRWDERRKVWRMWYAAGETYEPNVLCYAESPDGLSWKKWEGNQMFGHGPRDSWDRDRVGACEARRHGSSGSFAGKVYGAYGCAALERRSCHVDCAEDVSHCVDGQARHSL